RFLHLLRVAAQALVAPSHSQPPRKQEQEAQQCPDAHSTSNQRSHTGLDANVEEAQFRVLRVTRDNVPKRHSDRSDDGGAKEEAYKAHSMPPAIYRPAPIGGATTFFRPAGERPCALRGHAPAHASGCT